jgi:hypothetical protein
MGDPGAVGGGSKSCAKVIITAAVYSFCSVCEKLTLKVKQSARRWKSAHDTHDSLVENDGVARLAMLAKLISFSCFPHVFFEAWKVPRNQLVMCGLVCLPPLMP